MEGLSKNQQIKQKAAIGLTRRWLEKLQERNPELKTKNAAKILEWLDNPDEFNLNLETVIDCIKNATNTIPPEIIRDFALAIHDYYNKRSKWSEFVELGILGLEACRKIGDSDSMGIAYPTLCNNLGLACRMSGKKEEAMSYYQDALKRATRNEERSDALTHMCDIYRLWGETEKALECGRQAVELAKQIVDSDREAKGLEFTGLAYVGFQKYDSGIECYKQALDLRRQTENMPKEAMVLSYLAFALSHKSDTKELIDAINYYQQARALEEKLNNQQSLGRLDGDIAVAYNKLGRYEEAIEKSSSSLDSNIKIGFGRGIALNKARLVHSYIGLGHFEKALEQADDVCNSIKDLTEFDRMNLHGLSGMLLQLAHRQQSGNMEKAKKLTQSAIEFAEAAKDNESLQEAQNLLNKLST